MLHPFEVFKRLCSMMLLIYSIVLVSVMIFDEQTRMAAEVGSGIAFTAIILSLIWLSRVEGSQPGMVGLSPVQKKLYKDSHPLTFRICTLGHNGDNLDRFLMGRQFMVLVLVFIINVAGTPLDDVETTTKFSDVMIRSGLALILITAMIGQLYAQVLASHCMLDYINNYVIFGTYYLAMAIEFSGLLHSAYLIQYIFAYLSGKTVPTNEPPRNRWQSLFFWGRVVVSTGVVACSTVVVIVSILEEKTSMWESVPLLVTVVLFGICMVVVGTLEGMQIAFFSVARASTEEQQKANRWARWSCDVLFGAENNANSGLAGFLIGRQLLVAACYIIIARITTPTLRDEQDNILHVSDRVQKFFETGFLGAIMTTILGSIGWRLVAAAFPWTFLGNPICYVLLRGCLLIEQTGICSFVWVVSAVFQEFMGVKDDEEYIGTAEERAAKGQGDKSDAHGGTVFGGTFDFGRRGAMGEAEEENLEEFDMKDFENHMADLQKQMRDAKTDEERDALQREIDTLEQAARDHNARQRTAKKQADANNTVDSMSSGSSDNV